MHMGHCTFEDGGLVRPSSRVSGGDVLVIRRRLRDVKDVPDSYRVLHDDDHLYVVDKPAGMPAHPAGSYLCSTVASLAALAFPEAPPKLCHRIDRETSGVLVLARTHEAQRDVMRQFERRTVAKTYLALVHGRPDPPEGVVDVPLCLGRTTRIRMKMQVVLPGDHGSGMPAVTRYRTIETSGRFSLVECVPETGRQHQIRVHMEHLGNPLVGDKIYGQDESLFLRFVDHGLEDWMRERLILPNHALHARSITLRHPATSTSLTVTAPLPPGYPWPCEGSGP
jgi:23S rRNA pseudouridine1911/1915/1917 synthase